MERYPSGVFLAPRHFSPSCSRTRFKTYGQISRAFTRFPPYCFFLNLSVHIPQEVYTMGEPPSLHPPRGCGRRTQLLDNICFSIVDYSEPSGFSFNVQPTSRTQDGGATIDLITAASVARGSISDYPERNLTRSPEPRLAQGRSGRL